MNILAAIKSYWDADANLTAALKSPWLDRVGHDASGNPIPLPYGSISQLSNQVVGLDSLGRYIANPQVRITVYAASASQADELATTIRDELNGARLALPSGEASLALKLVADIVIGLEPEQLNGADVWSARIVLGGMIQRQRKPS